MQVKRAGDVHSPGLVPGATDLLTKKIRISRSAAADLCGDVLDWTRVSWWFRAWPGLYA
jgi:hypothetical protein